MWTQRLCSVLVAFSLLLCLSGPVVGKNLGSPGTPSLTPTPAASSADTMDTLRTGIKDVLAGRYDQAISHLTPLYQRDLTYNVSGEGSVAYWLGRAYFESGRSRTAISIWRSTLQTMRKQGKALGIRLADAYIRAVARSKVASEFDRAESVYLSMLGQVGEADWASRVEDVRERLTQHVRELAVLLPERLQRRTGITVDPYTLDISTDPSSVTGDLLVAWWRSKDPLPATERNERLQEHLLRVAYAGAHYTSGGTLDDRGKVFIRLGRPRDSTRVRSSPAAEATPHLAGVRIRENEFWTYPDVDQKAHYLFVKKEASGYELGDVDMLFPPGVRTGMNRSFDATLSYLEALQRVLGQLAAYHEDFGLRSSEAVDATQTALNKEEFGISSEEDPNASQSSVARARDVRRRNKRADRDNASKRANRVPNSYSTIGDRADDLPVQTRVTRFLTEGGDTQVDVDWGIRSAAGFGEEAPARACRRDLDQEASLLTFRGVREGLNYDVRSRTRSQYHSPSRRSDSAQTYTHQTTTSDSVFHLALQWDQYAGVTGKRSADGELLCRHVERLDSLEALHADPDRLEMSDLKLLTVPQDATIPSEEAVPYPFRRLEAGQPLALFFEIYHLVYNEDDRTRYTVSYQIERRQEQDGLSGLLGGDDREKTTTRTTNEGSSRRKKEYILLELGNLLDEKEGRLNVTVRVTDETSGQTVTRSLSFEVISPGE